MPVWAGFARSEIFDWWVRRGGEVVDLPADRFAERSRRDRRLIWEDIAAGRVIRGLACDGVVRVVTRQASPEELARFDHPRMPVIEPPWHPAADIELPPPEPDLFG
ncbi:MAG: hypothetical protein N2322_01175 [Terrimicrobiaceae bacterium]|nr:hypothetical protein [Terrimicrobiaceae bacterium]